jgi:flagellar protein FlaF
MTWEVYEAVAEDSSREARARERHVLNVAIERLERVQTGVPQGGDLLESLHYTRRLWAIFIEDLVHPENGLPEKLRADIISIGLWVLKEADRLQDEKSNDVKQLIEINRLMRDALS